MLHTIVTSDWHLDKLAKLFPHDHVSRQLKDVEKIFKYAIENGIRHVIIPGDISDTHKMSADTQMQLLSLIKKYDPYLHIKYIGGNHDFSDITKTSMDLIKLITDNGFFENFQLYISPEQVEIDGIIVNMMNHPVMEALPNKRPCLNMVHVEYTGAIGDNGRTLKSSKEFKSPRRDYNVSGHIHQYQHMEKRRVLYCGSPYQTNFGEKLPKGFVDLKVRESKGKIQIKHKFVDNKPGFRLLTEHIESASELGKLSTEPGIRYRLYVDEGVIVPSDMMLRNPNIVQLWQSGSKKKVEIGNELENFVNQTTNIPKTNPLLGLSKQFKASGQTKRDWQKGVSLVKEALSELNIQIEHD